MNKPSSTISNRLFRCNIIHVLLCGSLLINGWLITRERFSVIIKENNNHHLVHPVIIPPCICNNIESNQQQQQQITQTTTTTTNNNNNKQQLRNNKFYSQFSEDAYLYSKFFHSSFGQDYTFLEMGALDGTRFSNTRFLQETMGWSGYLIEPSQLLYHNLTEHSNRCAPRNGNKAICLKLAICSEWASNVNFIGAGEPVGGIDATLTAGHRKRFQKSFTSESIEQVLCGPIHDVLEMLGVQKLDLFSLDVEGGELAVLEKFNFNQVKVHVLIIERAPNSDGEKNKLIDDILIKNGFQFLEKQGRENMVWVNSRY
jgi:FkbM family methyltransferase